MVAIQYQPEFIQIQQEEGIQITTITCGIITTLSKFRSNIKDFDRDLSLLLLEKEKKAYLKQKLLTNLEELRKVIFQSDLKNISNFKDLQWRYQVELASKTHKNTFKPNILLNFKFEEEEGKIKNNITNCDYATLKHLHESLSSALKLHNSSKFNTARKSSV